MRIQKRNNYGFFFFLMFAVGCTSVNPPSKALDDYISRPEIEEELMELYFYPTTVRMLDKFISNGKGGILRGVEEGRLFYCKSDSLDILQRDGQALRKSLKAEGFELLGEFRSGEMTTVAYIRDLSTDRYVVLLSGKDVATMLVEMKGEISMATLNGLSELNSANVMSLLDLTSSTDEVPDETQPDDAEIEPPADSTNTTTTIKIEI